VATKVLNYFGVSGRERVACYGLRDRLAFDNKRKSIELSFSMLFGLYRKIFFVFKVLFLSER